MVSKEHLKKIGSRIFSEANDLKRTPETLAKDLGMKPQDVQNILDGERPIEDTYSLVARMGSTYPIDASDLLIPEDDTTNGVKIMRKDDSEASKRIFDRKDKTGALTPYYDYRDTAMSKLAPLKPEWIKELRAVENSDPENSDVAYNNGHFMHQATFFKGPVNFYWQDKDGIKHSSEMNTGDSNYITPFHPHSFTSRSQNEEALILAVTFGGDVRRAQKELYALGQRGVDGAMLDYRNHNSATSQLLKQHMRNERMSADNLQNLLESKGVSIELDSILSGKSPITEQERREISYVLNIEPSDLTIPKYRPEEEVIVKQKREEDGYNYPDNKNPNYRIHTLARTSKMPLMKGFDIQPLQRQIPIDKGTDNSLHTWAYNYGNENIGLSWYANGEVHKEVLHPGDSMIMQPYVPHSLSNPSDGDARLVSIGVPGALNLAAQKELSYFTSGERVAKETKKWF
jgi:uncharacterized RmlC-like cupin family protein